MAALTGRARLPRAVGDRWLLVAAVLLLALIAAGPSLIGAGYLRLLTEVLVVLAMAQMWNLLAGYAGLMSIGHQAFVGVGAYGLFAFSNFTGFSPYWSLFVAPLLCAALAAALAPVLFRLRDAYFAIGMWVVAEILAILVGKWPLLGRQYGMTLTGMRALDRDWFQPMTFWLAAGTAFGAILLYSPTGTWPTNYLSVERPITFAASTDYVEIQASLTVDLSASAADVLRRRRVPPPHFWE